MREENTFEDPVLAEEWIQAVETEVGGSRDREIYPMLSEWSKQLAPSFLVEIGSGQGVCSSKVHVGNGKYVGIEPSSALVQRAKELYREPYKEFLVGNAYAIPLGDAVADAAFSVGVWFHLKDLDAAHKELARIMKPGGNLLIITSNPTMHNLWESWFEKPVKEGNRIEGRIWVPSGILSRNIFYLHSEKDIADSLSRSGFSVTSVTKFGFGREGREVVGDEGVWMAMSATKS